QITFEEPRPPRRENASIPADLETIILKAIAKNPQERFATAQEMADDLRRFLEDKPIRAKRPTLVQRARKWSRRHPSILTAVGVVLVLAVIALSTSTVLIRREQLRTQRALETATRDRARARNAVDDMYSDVAEEWLRNQPGLQPVQKKFLHKALRYYEES